MSKQFSKHHDVRRHLTVGDRVVSTKNRREQGIIIKTTSNTNYSVSMTANSYDRIINHPGKGTPSPLYPYVSG